MKQGDEVEMVVVFIIIRLDFDYKNATIQDSLLKFPGMSSSKINKCYLMNQKFLVFCIPILHSQVSSYAFKFQK